MRAPLRNSVLILTLILLSISGTVSAEGSSGSLEGWVRNWDGDPVSGVTVRLQWNNTTYREVNTDLNGHYRMEYLEPGMEFDVMVFSAWTTNYTTNVTLEAGKTSYLNCSVEPVDVGGLEGVVRDSEGYPLYEVAVRIYPQGAITQIGFTDVEGRFEFETVPSGSCRILFQKNGYDDLSVENITIPVADWKTVRIRMNETPFKVMIDVEGEFGSTPLLPEVRLHFSRDLDLSTIDEESIRWTRKGSDEKVHYLITINDDRTLTIVPEEPLLHGTAYEIMVSDGVYDIFGNAFPQPVWEQIHTEPKIIERGPLKFEPGDGKINVDMDTNITVWMPDRMEIGTVDSQSFILSKADVKGTMMPGSFSFSDFNDTIIFDPFSNLEPLTRYMVTLSKDIRYHDRDLLFPGIQWSFTTAPEPATTGTISGVVPGLGRNYIDENDPYAVMTSDSSERTSYINGEGRFYFRDVEPGIWEVSVHAEGYEPWSMNVEIEAGSHTELPVVQLEEEPREDDPGLVLIIAVTTGSIIVILVILALLAGSFLSRTNGSGPETGPIRKKRGMITRRPTEHIIIEGHKEKKSPTSEEGDVAEEDPDEALIRMMMEMDEDELIEKVRNSELEAPRSLEPPPG